MTAPGTTLWVRQYGWTLSALTEGQRAFGVALDELERKPSLEGLAAASERLLAVIDRARAVPPLPGEPEGRLFTTTLDRWRSACLVWADPELTADSAHAARAMADWNAGTAAYGQLGELLKNPHTGVGRRLHQLVSTPGEAAEVADLDRAAGPAGATERAGYRLALHRERANLSQPGLWLAAFFGLAAWASVILAIVTGQGPVAGAVVIGVLGTLLLAPVVVFGRAALLMRRAVDVLSLDAAGITRTGQFLRFDVPWSEVGGVRLLTGETYRGEAAWAPYKPRSLMRGSLVALEFVPADPAAFERAHGVLAAGPAWHRFAAMGGRYGCVLGSLRRRTVDELAGALRQAAAERWSGVVRSSASS